MKNVLIGGMGNVLLGDDGFGPYVVHLLETQYRFSGNVEIEDIGTPALDLTHRIAGKHAVILIDCISTEEHPPGTVLAYDRADLLSAIPAQRLDPHSPAVSECLLAADMLGKSPDNLLLVGTVGHSFEPGEALSETVRRSIDKVIGAVLGELWRLGVEVGRKATPTNAETWWAERITLSIPQIVAR